MESGAGGCRRSASDATADGTTPVDMPPSSPAPRDAMAPSDPLLQAEGRSPISRGPAGRPSSQDVPDGGDAQAPLTPPPPTRGSPGQAPLPPSPDFQPPQSSHAEMQPSLDASPQQEPPTGLEPPSAGVAGTEDEGPRAQEATVRRRSPSNTHGPTHRTVPLREAVPSAVVGAVVPSLLDLSIKTIVQHSQVRSFFFWVWRAQLWYE